MPVPQLLPTAELLEEIDAANRRFEFASPSEILEWICSKFGEDLLFACSFEDVALLHMIWQRQPATPILFLDTKGHFPETLSFVEQIQDLWNLTIVTTEPGPEADGFPCGTERCCELRKVAPLTAALRGHSAWLSSVKRVDGPTRTDMPIVTWDEKFGLVKVNPLASWSDEDVTYYLQSQGLPEHPLWAEGYASIGCAAMTMKPLVPGDRRSGRWVGLDKSECGLHES
jgi:phosphoadenosine phosphosulfate reductase